MSRRVIYPEERVESDIEKGTPRYFLTYERVIKLGCGLEISWTAWGDEYDCGHGYTWDCESCPVKASLEGAKTVMKEKHKRMYREY